MWLSRCSAPSVEKTVSAPSYCFCSLTKDQLTIFMGVYFQRSFSELMLYSQPLKSTRLTLILNGIEGKRAKERIMNTDSFVPADTCWPCNFSFPYSPLHSPLAFTFFHIFFGHLPIHLWVKVIKAVLASGLSVLKNC